MNKSVITNLLALTFVLVGLLTEVAFKEVILSIGLFALAGGLTNWIAIHMLFEKIPFLYGSGVISARFEDFKFGIHELVMQQFFSKENLDKFFAEIVNEDEEHRLDFKQVIEATDLSPAFDGLLETIMESSFGGMLAMAGGEAAVLPLKEPFINKMKISLNDIAHSDSFQNSVREKLTSNSVEQDIHQQVEQIVQARLDELTPQMVKDIIQTMIRQHLGWLVVWGGVFGGLIGLITSQLSL